MYKKEFNFHKLRVQNRRVSYITVFGDLMKQQEEICLYCHEFMNLFNDSSFEIGYKTLF
jgi:hypothetical protein